MQDTLRNNFERFYTLLGLKSEDKELFWRFYSQGHQDASPLGEDIEMKDVEKMVENQCFEDFVKSCIEDKIPDSAVNPSDYVIIIYPCSEKDREKCIAWPDRCEEFECNKKFLNLSKLCGVESGKALLIKNKSLLVDKNILTAEEVDTISKAICDYYSKETKDASC